MASFAIDVVFVEGIGGAQGEEAAALLIVFLLWRILRIINGKSLTLMVTFYIIAILEIIISAKIAFMEDIW